MLPVVPHFTFSLQSRTRRTVEQYARQLLLTGCFRRDEALHEYAVKTLNDAPSLLLDDFTDIALFNSRSLYMEQRARLRAGDGDIVATITPVDDAFDHYVTDGLQLGNVDWLQVPVPEGRISLANHCWRNRDVRRDVVHAIRSRGLRYLHPHMGNSDVWRLAQLLSRTSHCDVRVIGPPPAVSHWANDKVAFAKVVTDLLGSQFVPATRSAYCHSFLAKQVQELARSSHHLGVKVPHATGGAGNLFLDSKPLLAMSLPEIDDLLRRLIPEEFWLHETAMLVDVWEDQVLQSASIQTWIPPVADGEPIIEGIFAQLIQGEAGEFMGCIPLVLPDGLQTTIAESTSVLVKLFQLVGYVGRCSFDFLLVGEDMATARVEFIECNGRWGGTSIPMTVVNRLFGDYFRKPFAAFATDAAFASSDDFANILHNLSDDLYQTHGSYGEVGWLIPFNPGRIGARNGLNWIVLGNDPEQVRNRLNDLPAIISHRLSSLGTPPSNGGDQNQTASNNRSLS